LPRLNSIQSGQLSEEKMVEIVKKGNIDELIELAKSDYTTEYVLDLLARSPSITILHEVAKNSNCSRKRLRELSDYPDMLVADYARRNLKHKLALESEALSDV